MCVVDMMTQTSIESSDVIPQLPPIDVIVPVYIGSTEVEACLASVLNTQASQSFNIIVVNDASPDPVIEAYLRSLADAGRIDLHNHHHNAGFIAAIATGTAVNPHHDFIILNADTRVAGNWVERLARTASTDAAIATVTPFTNNGEIASYPSLGVACSLPLGETVESLDRICQEVNRSQSVDLPTAVGFCCYVRRLAWDALGGFDTLFGRGYGEEVDFCLRASALGWRHVLATDVFVFHQGAVSFGDDSSNRKTRAQQIVDQRHPHFPELVRHFCALDAPRVHRLRVTLARLGQSSLPKILMVSHDWGGGVARHVDEWISRLRSEGLAHVLLLRPAGSGHAKLTLHDAQCEELLCCAELSQNDSDWIHLLTCLNISFIHFHHTLMFPEWVLNVPQAINAAYAVTVHDYYCVCPQLHFIDREGRYCGRPTESGCTKCLDSRPDPWGLGIVAWRKRFWEFLSAADTVIVPSESTRSILADYFPGLPLALSVHYEPHVSEYRTIVSDACDIRQIVVIGHISRAKGLSVVADLLAEIKARQLPIVITVIGTLSEPIGHPESFYFRVTGEFQESELKHYLSACRPDALLFPSVIPETYSYVLSSAMATGLPVFGFDLGAIGERLRSYQHGKVLPVDTSPRQLSDQLLQVPCAFTSMLVAEQPSESGCPPPLPSYLERLGQIDHSGIYGIDMKAIHIMSNLHQATDWAVPPEPMSELVPKALECKQREIRDLLPRHAIDIEKRLEAAETQLIVDQQEMAHLRTVSDDLRRHLSTLDRRLAAKDRDVLQLNALYGSSREELAKARADYAVRQGQVDELTGALKVASAEKEAMLQSFSWKITAPLRYIRRYFRIKG